MVINETYDDGDHTTWTDATEYDDTSTDGLEVYSLRGAAGATALSQFGVYFDTLALVKEELNPSDASCVRANDEGAEGGWRPRPRHPRALAGSASAGLNSHSRCQTTRPPRPQFRSPRQRSRQRNALCRDPCRSLTASVVYCLVGAGAAGHTTLCAR